MVFFQGEAKTELVVLSFRPILHSIQEVSECFAYQATVYITLVSPAPIAPHQQWEDPQGRAENPILAHSMLLARR